MTFIQTLAKRIPSSPSLPSLASIDEWAPKKERGLPHLGFFKRRIRLKGNSKVSIPLGLVLLFPLIVVILILVIVVRHPSSPGQIFIPAGAPPAIRYVTHFSQPPGYHPSADTEVGKSVKSTTGSSLQDALNRKRMAHVPMQYLSYLRGTRNWRVLYNQ